MTSDERREAAERLREVALHPGVDGDVWVYDATAASGLEVGEYESYLTPESVERLADLIDPTCEDMATHREDAFAPGKKACDGYFSCCRCNFNGRVFEGIGFGDMATMEVRYCPNCGARVVRGDGE